MVNVILSRLKERSTYAGLATLVAAIGWKVDPEQWSAIGAAVISAISLYEVFRKEK